MSLTFPLYFCGLFGLNRPFIVLILQSFGLDPLYLFVINTNVYNPIGVTNLALILGNLSKLLDLGPPGSLLRRGITEIAAESEKRQQTSVSNQKEIDKLRNAAANGVDTRNQKILQPRDSKIFGAPTGTIDSYPSDLSKFYMRMDFKKYSRPSPNVSGFIETEYSVAFPLPTNLEDKHDIDYNPYDADFVGAIANSLNAEQAVTASAAINPFVQGIRKFGGQNIVNIASQSLAAALNPNKSIIFESVKFRSYSFSWNFAPNTEQESETLRKIIRRIKSYSLPTYAKMSQGGPELKVDYNIFNYPYMVKVWLYPWSGETFSDGVRNIRDPEMFKTKHCVIDSISINYAPENNLSFFNSERNSPTFVSLSLNLTEIELFTGEDFGREGEELNLNNLETVFNKLTAEDAAVVAPKGVIDNAEEALDAADAERDARIAAAGPPPVGALGSTD